MRRCSRANWRCFCRCGAGEGGGKAIAAAGNVEDISGTPDPVTEGLTQSGDVETEAALVDVDVGPDALDQFSLVDNFTWVFGKHDENVECSPADGKWSSILFQQP